MPTQRAIEMEELSQYFKMPEKAVAKHLGICLTSLKKICRQNGIHRWPYRKVCAAFFFVFLLYLVCDASLLRVG